MNIFHRILAVLVILLSTVSAQAGPNDFIFMQRNAADSGNTQRVIASPATTGFFTYFSDTKLGGYTTLGQGLTISNGVLSSSVTSGPPGTAGATGPAGPAGPTGPQGATGASGAQGVPGIAGTNGQDGAAGMAGATGQKGDTGAPGAMGPAGATGATGSTGAKGDAGPAGATGAAGAQGISGPTGATGLAGQAGAQGVAGPQGLIGLTGATGAQGIQGLTGATGAAGAQGPIGITGATGLTGTQGLQGATGPQGPAGAAAVIPSRIKASITRALATCFQLSATRDTHVTYNVQIDSTMNLTGGQRGTLYLETFTDAACTAGIEEVMHSTSGNTAGLNVTLANTVTQTLNVNGYVMAGLYAKLRTANDSGTPTFTVQKGQEVIQ